LKSWCGAGKIVSSWQHLSGFEFTQPKQITETLTLPTAVHHDISVAQQIPSTILPKTKDLVQDQLEEHSDTESVHSAEILKDESTQDDRVRHVTRLGSLVTSPQRYDQFLAYNCDLVITYDGVEMDRIIACSIAGFKIRFETPR
jgi:hypothetical protein